MLVLLKKGDNNMKMNRMELVLRGVDYIHVNHFCGNKCELKHDDHHIASATKCVPGRFK
jgi:hypothetical protein